MPTQALFSDGLQVRTVQVRIGERLKGDDSPRFRVSISSEEPVALGDGSREILDHSEGAVDMRRARAGLPLLFMHDRSAPVGVIEAVQLMNRRLEGVARFGNSRAAQECLADVLAGTLANMSIGYLVHESRSEPGGIVRATRWEPYEASLVSIPADPTVGINRSLKEVPVTDNPTPAQQAATSGGGSLAQVEAARAAERNRIRDIQTMVRQFNMPAEVGERAIEDGTSVRAFEKRVLEHLSSGDQTPIRSEATRSSAMFGGGRDDRLAAQFSIGRAVAAAITGDWSQAGLEREVSQEIARRAGRNPEGIFVPSFALAKRALLTSTSSGGVFGTEHAGDAFIGALKAEVSVMNLGATVMHGLSKDVSIPRMTAGTSAHWIGEGNAPADSAPTFDTVPLAFKQLSATVQFSRKMAIQADPGFEALMRDDIRQEIAIALDRAAIAGTGASDQPTGILNTAGVGLVEMGAAGGAITWPKVLEFTAAVEFANAAVGNLGWLTNAKVKAQMMQTERAEGTAKFILDDQAEARLAGYRVAFSNIVPADGTKGAGTNLSAMIFGNWKDLLIGEFGGMDLIIDPYTESAKGNIRISVHSYWDIAVRHAASFAIAEDIDTAA